MRLLVIPLVVLTIVTLFGIFVGEAAYGVTEFGMSEELDYYYDSEGVAKLNVTSMDPVNAAEDITIHLHNSQYATFSNTTGGAISPLLGERYLLYYDQNAEYPVNYIDLGNPNPNQGASFGVDLNSNLGFIAVIVGISVFAAVIGLKIFGTGMGETSTHFIITIAALLALWAIVSLGSLPVLTTIPTFGNIFYLLLTLMYTMGSLQMAGGGSSE